MRTKRYLLIAALLMLIAGSGKMQGADNGLDVRAVQGVVPGFRLWFANNVTDVQDFDKITSADSGLEWREVHDKDIDGNSAEVDRLRQMLASTGMKGIEQQRQFWTMRDRTLLYFRIDDDAPTTPDSYEVEVTNTDSGEWLSKTVTKFFFVNLPLVTPPSSEYAITVTNLDEPSQKIRFKYTVYDWNNENLYIFQLDRLRQLTGKGYEMEYSTGYMDEEGFLQKETKTLSLKEKSFQSFYVPEGSDLLDVVLIGDENKLRINKGRHRRRQGEAQGQGQQGERLGVQGSRRHLRLFQRAHGNWLVRRRTA